MLSGCTFIPHNETAETIHMTTITRRPRYAAHPTSSRFALAIPQQARCVQMARLLAAGALFAGANLSLADIINLQVTIDGMQEVPSVDTPAKGSGTLTYDTDTRLLSWNMTFSGLKAGQTAAHFHGPAFYCSSAGVTIGLQLGSPIIGSATLTEQQATDMLNGLWYVNIHSSAHPGGEIRGQVMPVPLDDPIPAPIEVGGIDARLELVSTGLTAPNWGTAAPGVTNRLFVVDQDGILWKINLNDGTKTIFADFGDRLVELGAFGPGTFDERGFLGVAFHPDYQQNGLLYTYTSQPTEGDADFSTMPNGVEAHHQAVITEWLVPNPGDPNATVDPNSDRELFRVDQPQFNHNGGCLAFGPDGYLYIAFGDGGGADDQDGQVTSSGPMVGHGCIGNGQNINSVLGAVLRVDPLGSNSANGQYGIPGDNPFVGVDGTDEIYAYGLRNPFRFSFDAQTGAFWVTDVGQNDIEEINLVEAGGNYGWRYKEGSFYFVPNGGSSGYVTDRPLAIPAMDLIDPIAQYDHDEGLSIIGGFVYRGSDLPALRGRYVFAEFGRNFNNDGRLFWLDADNTIREFDLPGDGSVGRFVLGMGQGPDGELYVLTNQTGVPFESTGEVWKLSGSLSLETAGECPGLVTVNISGATPGATVALLRATGTGSSTIPGGPCAGTVIGLNGTAAIVDTVVADVNGDAVFSGRVPAAGCRLFVQAVEAGADCRTSNVSGL